MQDVRTYQGTRVIEGNTASLLSRVLWITTVGFLFTALGAYFAPPNLGFGLLFVFIINFGLIFAINAASRRSPGLALVLFYGLTLLMGVQIGPLLQSYVHMPGGTTIVFQAAMTTALGMGVMAAIAQVARFNYQRVGQMAFWALIGLVILGVLAMFVHFVNPTIYAWLSLVIFSVLLLVDFMRLRDGALGLSPVQMALSIYLDALNIFIALLQIFGGGRRDRGNWS